MAPNNTAAVGGRQVKKPTKPEDYLRINIHKQRQRVYGDPTSISGWDAFIAGIVEVCGSQKSLNDMQEWELRAFYEKLKSLPDKGQGVLF